MPPGTRRDRPAGFDRDHAALLHLRMEDRAERVTYASTLPGTASRCRAGRSPAASAAGADAEVDRLERRPGRGHEQLLRHVAPHRAAAPPPVPDGRVVAPRERAPGAPVAHRRDRDGLVAGTVPCVSSNAHSTRAVPSPSTSGCHSPRIASQNSSILPATTSCVSCRKIMHGAYGDRGLRVHREAEVRDPTPRDASNRGRPGRRGRRRDLGQARRAVGNQGARRVHAGALASAGRASSGLRSLQESSAGGLRPGWRRMRRPRARWPSMAAFGPGNRLWLAPSGTPFRICPHTWRA